MQHCGIGTQLALFPVMLTAAVQVILVIGREASPYKHVKCMLWLSHAGGIGRAVRLWEDHILRESAAFSARYGLISQYCIGPPSLIW